jgi:hypothetical protein
MSAHQRAYDVGPPFAVDTAMGTSGLTDVSRYERTVAVVDGLLAA